MGRENSQLQPGDLIEVDRPFHQHWALYIGDGYVINLTPEGKKNVQLGVHTMPAFIREVKKQHLKAVVQKNKWRVNNKYDDSYSPLPVVEIIRCAVGYIGKFMTYRVFGSNCEHFVTMLRYGEGVSEQPRTSVGGELQNLDTTENKDCPKPGDLIKIERGPYKQWALYMGDGDVIHVTALDENGPPLSASSKSTFIRKARVTKELLKVGINDDWAVNNKYDCDRTPLPVEEIIWRAEGCIGKELPYDDLGIYSEDFVTNLRYGDPMRASVGGELPILNMTEDKDCPKPGDLIEIKRSGYQHWALYMWSGYVVHVTAIDENAPSLSASTVTILSRKAKVKKELLMKVTGTDTWHVNNKYDHHHIPLSVEKIIQRAEQWIGRVVPYGLFGSNCEHFVTMLRYGEGFSWQAKMAFQYLSCISHAMKPAIATATTAFLASLTLAAGFPFLSAVGILLGNVGLTLRASVFSSPSSELLEAKRYILEKICC